MQQKHQTEAKQRRKPGENRERLIAAGINEFSKYGYHGASTTGIAKVADVPQPHVYANFDTKLDLFLTCVDRVAHLLNELNHGEFDQSQFSFSDSSLYVNSAHLSMFLYQMVASSLDPICVDAVTPKLVSLRSSLGPNEFEMHIVEGAHSILTGNYALQSF